jgi:hypothetical protein
MTGSLPYREKVIACERGGTYKYFLAADRVIDVWKTLAERYGEAKRDSVRATMEIETRAFIVRSTLLGNPLTVFRKRTCEPADIAGLHEVFGFEERGDG